MVHPIGATAASLAVALWASVHALGAKEPQAKAARCAVVVDRPRHGIRAQAPSSAALQAQLRIEILLHRTTTVACFVGCTERGQNNLSKRRPLDSCLNWRGFTIPFTIRK